jgi:hypothetical protein
MDDGAHARHFEIAGFSCITATALTSRLRAHRFHRATILSDSISSIASASSFSA